MSENRVQLQIGAPRKHTRTDKQMEFLLDKYLELHPDHEPPLDPQEVCQWAIEKGIYVPKPVPPIEELKRRFCRHLSHRYIIDPQKREARALHAVPHDEITPEGVRQGYLYYPLFTTEPEKIRLALSWRRDGVRNRVIQIETDRRSYNDNNIFGATIEQMNFDFNPTAIESQLPTVYPEAAPSGLDDDDEPPI